MLFSCTYNKIFKIQKVQEMSASKTKKVYSFAQDYTAQGKSRNKMQIPNSLFN